MKRRKVPKITLTQNLKLKECPPKSHCLQIDSEIQDYLHPSDSAPIELLNFCLWKLNFSFYQPMAIET